MQKKTVSAIHRSAENQPPYSAVVRSGSLVAFGGQNGAPGDIEEQLGRVVEKISMLLEQVDAALRHLVKLVVFYRSTNGLSAHYLRERLSVNLPSSRGIALTLVPVRELSDAESIVEIEGYALVGDTADESQRNCVTLADLPPPGAAFCHGLRCAEFVFVSGQSAQGMDGQAMYPDLPGQNRRVLENIDRILGALGADRKDIVKANTWRLPPPDVEQYRAAAKDRFSYFGEARPAVTGITVPDVAGDSLLITIDAWAMRNPDNSLLPRQFLQPLNHWDWSVITPYSHGLRCGRYLFVGGQAALDQSGGVLQPGNVMTQTRDTMDYVGAILQAGAASFSSVIKMNTLYVAGKNGCNYRPCLETRNPYIQSSAPASTAIPVDVLAYPGQVVEIEAIAILD